MNGEEDYFHERYNLIGFLKSVYLYYILKD